MQTTTGPLRSTVHGRFAGCVGPVDPEAVLLETLDLAGAVRDPFDVQPVDRARGGARGRRGQGRRATVADQHPADARALADPEQGAQVPRVLNVLDQDDELGVDRGRRRIATFRVREAGREAACRRMVLAGLHEARPQLAGRDVADRHAMPFAEPLDRPAAVAGGTRDEDLGDSMRLAPQDLPHRLVPQPPSTVLATFRHA